VEWWFCFVLREGENEMKTEKLGNLEKEKEKE
jgi:hypothetical protein